MVANVAFAGKREREAARLRQQVDADLERVRKALLFIRRMNAIYQERLDGKRRPDD